MPWFEWLARKLEALSHTVRIIPAQFAKPYVKSNTNDITDAAAIAKAVTRPTIRFVKANSIEQVELQTMHRIRDRLVGTKTQLSNQIGAFLLKFGIAVRSGPAAIKGELPKALAYESNDLTTCMRSIISTLSIEMTRLEERIGQSTKEIEAVARSSGLAMRLASIPGVGLLTAMAILSPVGNGKHFHKALDMAAWIGLVPAQHSTGGKPTLRGISKRANPYVRRLLILGARVCVMHLDRTTDRLGALIRMLQERMHINKVVIAIANKLARIAWVILNHSGALHLPQRGATT